jgi:transposase-like protein
MTTQAVPLENEAPQPAPEVASVPSVPADWPACPRCGSTEFVHRAGYHHRLQHKSAQRYSCLRCGKNHKFLSPGEARFRPGKIRNLKPSPKVPITERIEEIRQLAAQFPQHEVARIIGVHRSYMTKTYHKYGIPTKRFLKSPKHEEKIKAKEKTDPILIDKKMREMAAVRGLSVENYLRQLVEADFAETRSKSFTQTAVKPIVGEAPRGWKPPVSFAKAPIRVSGAAGKTLGVTESNA